MYALLMLCKNLIPRFVLYKVFFLGQPPAVWSIGVDSLFPESRNDKFILYTVYMQLT